MSSAPSSPKQPQSTPTTTTVGSLQGLHMQPSHGAPHVVNAIAPQGGGSPLLSSLGRLYHQPSAQHQNAMLASILPPHQGTPQQPVGQSPPTTTHTQPSSTAPAAPSPSISQPTSPNPAASVQPNSQSTAASPASSVTQPSTQATQPSPASPSVAQPAAPAPSVINPPLIPPAPLPNNNNALKRPLEYVREKLNKLHTAPNTFQNQQLQNGAIRNDAGLHLTDPQDQETMDLATLHSADNRHLSHAYLYLQDKRQGPLGRAAGNIFSTQLGYEPQAIYGQHPKEDTHGKGRATDKVTTNIPTSAAATAEHAQELRKAFEKRWGQTIDRGATPFDELAMDRELDLHRRAIAGSLHRYQPEHLDMLAKFVGKIEEQYPNIYKQHKAEFDTLLAQNQEARTHYDPQRAKGAAARHQWNEETATWDDIHNELQRREQVGRELLKTAQGLIKNTDLKHSPYANQVYALAWNNWRHNYNANDHVENFSNFAKEVQNRARQHRSRMQNAASAEAILPNEDAIDALARHADQLPHADNESNHELVSDYITKAKNGQFQSPNEAKKSREDALAVMRQFHDFMRNHTITPANHPHRQFFDQSQNIKVTPSAYQSQHQSMANDWESYLNKFSSHWANFQQLRAKNLAQKEAALKAIEYRKSPNDATYQNMKDALQEAQNQREMWEKQIADSQQNSQNQIPANSEYKNDLEPSEMDNLIEQVSSLKPLNKSQTWIEMAKEYADNPTNLKQFLRKHCAPLTKEVVEKFGRIVIKLQ